MNSGSGEVNTLTGEVPSFIPGIDSEERNPLAVLKALLNEHGSAVREAMVASLATVDDMDAPWARQVLLKDIDENTVLIGSSLVGRKWNHIRLNPSVCLNLYWREVGIQVSIGGQAHLSEPTLSDQLFEGRSASAQAIAIASRQSAPLADPLVLKDSVSSLLDSGKDLQRPETWSGILIEPTVVELSASSKDRFHRRRLYTKAGTIWSSQWLQP